MFQLVTNIIGQPADSTQRESALSHWVKKQSYAGSIKLENQYGLIPAAQNVQYPNVNNVLSGNVGIAINKIPVKLDFYYSTLGYVSGINNRFRLSFDVNQYKKNLNNVENKIKLENNLNVDSLFRLKQDYTKKLEYLKYQRKIDSVSITAPSPKEIELKADNREVDMDSLRLKETEYVNYLKKIEHLIDAFQNVNKLNTQTLDTGKIKKPKMPFEYVKSLEVGMCYPKYSKFLVAGAPISGINGEFQIKKMFVAVTYGKTVSNFYSVTNSYQSNKNSLTSYLGIVNQIGSRTVASLKTGYGTKKGNHIFIGFMIGDSGNNSILSTQRNLGKANNYVGELDARVVVKKNHVLDVIYGKSQTLYNNPEFPNQEFSFRSYKNTTQNNALFLKYSGKAQKIGAKYSLLYRYIEPYFESYGTGFLKSDNAIVELKWDQRFSKKLKAGGSVRYQRDDVLDIHGVQNRLFSYGVSITYRPIRALMVKMAYKPFSLSSEQNQGIRYHSDNKVFNAIVTYTKKKKKNFITLSGILMHYNLNNGVIQNTFNNISLLLSNNLNNKWLLEFGSNYYFSSDTIDTSNEWMSSVKLGLNIQKAQISITYKNTINTKSLEFNYGCKVGFSYNIYKKISAHFSFEKVLLGAFYKNIGYATYTEPNYRMNTSLSIKW